MCHVSSYKRQFKASWLGYGGGESLPISPYNPLFWSEHVFLLLTRASLAKWRPPWDDKFQVMQAGLRRALLEPGCLRHWKTLKRSRVLSSYRDPPCLLVHCPATRFAHLFPGPRASVWCPLSLKRSLLFSTPFISLWSLLNLHTYMSLLLASRLSTSQDEGTICLVGNHSLAQCLLHGGQSIVKTSVRW